MSRAFELSSSYSPAGDQPKAIKALVEGLEDGLARQILLGVTGSGKTFTMANVIEKVQSDKLNKVELQHIQKNANYAGTNCR